MYYHVWFVTKYARPILEGEIDKKVKEYFMEIKRSKGYEILEMETNKDHVHMMIEARNKPHLSGIMRVIKSVSSKKIREHTPHLRAGNTGSFWARSFGYSPVSSDYVGSVRMYIRNQKRRTTNEERRTKNAGVKL